MTDETKDTQQMLDAETASQQTSSEAESIPTEWSKSDYLWRIPLPGIGHSSPVVLGDRIYVSSATQADAHRHLCC